MKNLNFTKFYLAIILLPLTFIGCSEDDDNVTPSDSNNDGVKKGFAFVKDGENFDYSENAKYTSYVNTIQSQNKAAANRPYNQLSLGVDSMRLGKYTIEDPKRPPNARYTEYFIIDSAPDPQIDYKAVEGEINIESFNKEKETVSGTFNFVGVSNSSDTVRITNGEFNIKEEEF